MATKTMTMEIPAREAAAMAAAIQEYIEKIDRSLERSKRTQARIAKLKAETAVLRTRVEARIEKLCGTSC
jgi:ribosome-associated translation inhibitor RaiA